MKALNLLILSLIQLSSAQPDPRGRLILTPLIKASKFNEAKKLAQVTSLPDGTPKIDLYTGFITVNQKYNSNLFFWFFPNKDPKAPFLVWLEGGPGASSTSTIFLANGPWYFTANGTGGVNPESRADSWTTTHHVLYIDSPVGAGFSFTDSEEGYTKFEKDVTRDLWEFFDQFFKLFSDYQSNPFYLTGESYAGHYVPAMGKVLDDRKNSRPMDFRGIAIGNPWIDPILQSDYGSFLYEIGFLTEEELEYAHKYQKDYQELIKQGKLAEATKMFDNLIAGPVDGSIKSWLYNVTGQEDFYNFIRTVIPDDWSYYGPWITSEPVRKAIHVGDQEYFDSSNVVYKNMAEDVSTSTKSDLEQLIKNKYKVLIFSGNLDIIVPTPATDNLVNNLNWSGKTKWYDAEKKIWTEEGGDEVLGYVTNLDNLWWVVIRNAGHVVPYDQPAVALAMINKFTNGTL